MSNFTAAGILPRSTYNNQDYYYFGVTKNKGELTTFCGNKDASDKNVKACAIREFNEESLGAIADKKTIKKVLGDKKKVKKIENNKAKQVTYIATLKIKGNPLAKFQKAVKKPGLPAHKKEITEIVAIPRAQVIQLIASGNHYYQGRLFRGDAWGTLDIANQHGKL